MVICSMKLKNKIIIVTGGSGLLGKEFLLKIRAEGGVGLNLDLDIKTNLEKFNVNCDITNKNSVKKAYNLIKEKFIKIDGIVNNAYPRTKDWGKSFEDTKIESWQENINLQLSSHFLVTKIFSKSMIKNKNGSIVNIGSIYGIVGPDFTIYNGTNMTNPPAYSAIKGGMINFTRYLSSYLGKYNIRVNSISPGGIFDNQDKTFVENYSQKVPLSRMGNPEDISPGLIYLLSSDSDYITGHNLVIDGGWTSI